MEYVCHNGTILTPAELTAREGLLLDAGYLYQRIRTTEHYAPDLSAHLEILNRALDDIHGLTFDVSASQIENQIGACLRSNRYSERLGTEVMLRLFPSPKGVSCLIECCGPLCYNDYVVWHERPALEVFPCEYLYMGYPTAVSRFIGRYGREVAARTGAGAAVIENSEGTLTHVEDEPLFAVIGQEIFTSPLADGVPDSVLRRKVLAACRAEGRRVIEQRLSRNLLAECDELFYPTVQGLTSVMSYGGRLYYNFTSPRLVRHL